MRKITMEQKLRKLIREEISLLKEENEELKAQSVCKSALFKIKTEADKLANVLIKDGIMTKYQSKIMPYNRGYELRFDCEIVNDVFRDVESSLYNKGRLAYKLFKNGSIFLQPDSFFQAYLDEGKPARIEGREFAVGAESYVGFRHTINSREDIPVAAKLFIQRNINTLRKAQMLYNKL